MIMLLPRVEGAFAITAYQGFAPPPPTMRMRVIRSAPLADSLHSSVAPTLSECETFRDGRRIEAMKAWRTRTKGSLGECKARFRAVGFIVS